MVRFLIFGVLGVFGQVIATCVMGMISTRRIDLGGRASVLLFPFWGLIALIYPMIAIRVGSLPWYGRGAVYMAVFFVLQLLLGLLLGKTGLRPWSYSGKAQLMGILRPADAPAFFAAGLAIEWIYPHVKVAAAAIG